MQENPINAYDAATWIGRLSVHQDIFWFLSLLAWGLAFVLWWRHPQRSAAWAWLPGAGVATLGTALVQFGIFNPTFDLFQDRLIPGTVANYRPALINPHWLGDVLIGASLAGLAVTWGWLAAGHHGRPHLRWPLAVVAAATVLLHAVEPIGGGALLVLLIGGSGAALWPLARTLPAARRAFLAAVLLPLASTVGPVAAAAHVLQRSSPPTPMGLAAAAFQLGLGLAVFLCLIPGVLGRQPAATVPAFRRDLRVLFACIALLLAVGIAWAVKTGQDNRQEIQLNRLRAAAAQAMVFDPALLLPLHAPEFRLDGSPGTGELPPARSPWIARGAADAARRRLDEVLIATPFLDTARIVLIKDGWLVAALSTAHGTRAGQIEVLRRATTEDRRHWADKQPYVEESPVPEIGYAYYCRAPIVAPDGRMLGWLDCVRREYYLSVERRWRAGPFLMTALGFLLLLGVFQQRQVGREREFALRSAAVAAEGSRIKSAFLANVSHELRTPLQSILGYGELLEADAAPADRAAHLAAIRQQGRVMLRLVNDLIDLSAVEAGSFKLVAVPCDPAAILRDTVRALQAQATAKGLLLECAVAPRTPAGVTADESRLRQVLLNLLGNAIKFTDRGSIHASLGAKPDPNGRWRLDFQIEDTGPGVPPADQARIFQAFTRLAPAAAKEGSGLGLAVSAALCRAMGGSLTVESDGVHGSRFTATIRVPDVTGLVPAAAPAAVPVPAGVRRVLVVEDNPLVRELFVTGLTARGARCRVAPTAAAALAEVAREAPDAIVLDLALPDRDGAALAPELRHLCPGVRIVGASAHAGTADRARALAAGMDVFLVKPVRLEDLWSAIAGGTAPAAVASPPPNLMQRLRAEFIRELPERTGRIETALAAGDWAAVRAEAHYLRNGALVLHTAGLYTACTGLEEAATEAAAEPARRWWRECATELAALQRDGLDRRPT